ncbi:MAG: crossover junction endodeoxyribonuclease RuvC [Desulfatiglandaceae bacterium]|jgi:crossover junction endodeoxyribonuclease RuvC
MLVLGVDPGSNVTGFGLVEKKNGRLACVHSGFIRPPGKAPFYQRIHYIFREIGEVIRCYGPREMAIEDLFYAKNVKSSLKLAHARGAILVAAVQNGVGIFEYTPLEIKKSVVGYGRASKEQVRAMVQVILKLKSDFALDTSDALATAICHLNWARFDKLTTAQNSRRSKK